MTLEAWQEELAIREEFARRDGVLASLFDIQRKVNDHPSRKKAVKCSRRSGKTRLFLTAAIDRAKRNPDTCYPYVALTQRSAKYITWPVLRAIDRELGLNLDLKDGLLEARFPNRSTIVLHGGDREDLQDRMLGGGVNIGDVFLDETAAFRTSVRRFINDILWPTLLDRRGSLYMGGCPTDILSGYFYDVTREEHELREPGWETWEWGTGDNPHMAAQFAEMCNGTPDVPGFLQEFGPQYQSLPWFIRQWLGRWCKDTENNVYEYPGDGVEEWDHSARGTRYVCGMDTGFTDGMAYVVACYNPDQYREWVVLKSLWRVKQSEGQIVEQLREFMDTYPGIQIVGDPNNAQLLDELNNRHGVPVTKADKTDKHAWVRLMNGDFARGNIKLLTPELGVMEPVRKADGTKTRWLEEGTGCTTKGLAREWVNLKKKYFTDGAWEEDRSSWTNHRCDAALYAYRHSFPYLHREVAPEPEEGTPEWYKKEAKRMRTLQMARARKKARRPTRGLLVQVPRAYLLAA